VFGGITGTIADALERHQDVIVRTIWLVWFQGRKLLEKEKN
jgi:hypothetical protein